MRWKEKLRIIEGFYKDTHDVNPLKAREDVVMLIRRIEELTRALDICASFGSQTAQRVIDQHVPPNHSISPYNLSHPDE